MHDHWLHIVGFSGGALASVLVGLAASLWLDRRRNEALPTRLVDSLQERDGIIFLFEGQELLDATPEAERLLNTVQAEGDCWRRCLAALDRLVPGAAQRLECLHRDRQSFFSHEDLTAGRTLKASLRHGLIRISLQENSGGEEQITLRRDVHTAQEQELRFLRDLTAAAPLPMWCEDTDGTITWANRPYLDLAAGNERSEGQKIDWPPVHLFPPTDSDADRDTPVQASLPEADEEAEPIHYEVHRQHLDRLTIGIALPNTRAMRAETRLHDFTQTLTKTFAQVPIGLAVFDAQDRRLILFNPALSHLTSLEPEWLGNRPALNTFLDCLRERQKIPEPRDYKSWRREILELPPGTSYLADWTLPGGQTYRVTGCPDSTGALVLAFQDVSSEMALIRSFRLDLEMMQAVLNHGDDAIAVFSRGGALEITNSAFGTLWDHDPTELMQETDVVEATRIWSAACEPSPIWGELRDFVTTFTERSEWSGQLRTRTGMQVQIHVAPLPGGATLVRFTALGSLPVPLGPAVPKSAEHADDLRTG